MVTSASSIPDRLTAMPWAPPPCLRMLSVSVSDRWACAPVSCMAFLVTLLKQDRRGSAQQGRSIPILPVVGNGQESGQEGPPQSNCGYAHGPACGPAGLGEGEVTLRGLLALPRGFRFLGKRRGWCVWGGARRSMPGRECQVPWGHMMGTRLPGGGGIRPVAWAGEDHAGPG